MKINSTPTILCIAGLYTYITCIYLAGCLLEWLVVCIAYSTYYTIHMYKFKSKREFFQQKKFMML